MAQFETHVTDIIQRTHDVKSFRFKKENEASFKPGQFFFVTIEDGGKEMTKHFSFSNSPTEDAYFEFTKRLTQSPYSQALNKLKAGDWARLKMPYGNFTYEGEYKKLAFLSGGIGITPIRSICKFAADKKLPADIVLLYGNNGEEDIIFKQDFDEMQKTNKNIRVVHTLTAPDIDKNLWRGRTGYINEGMIKDEIPDYAERIFYVCGPPKMVGSMVDILNDKLRVQKDKIRFENFTGY